MNRVIKTACLAALLTVSTAAFAQFGGMGGGANQPPAVDMKSLAEKADNSGYAMVKDMKASETYPDALTFRDGKKVTKENWPARQEEISKLYQYYVYGQWRDGSDEKVSYTIDDSKKSMKITIKRVSTGKEGTMNVTVTLPDESKNKMPEGGWPVVVGLHGGVQEQLAASRGYAAIILSANAIASDNNRHTGLFYDLYPYGEDWKEQTGVLMAWSWGAAKILDALEAGAGKELKINAKNSAITGVSRYGKAAIVCGAFEKRFKMVMPSCSGAGGVAMFRYVSEGKTYDFSSKNDSKSYTYGKNEPIDSLQATGEQGWFNNKFMAFNDAKTMPFDQYMLCSLCADPNRYLFIIGSCTGEDWVNAPAMWFTYRGAAKIFQFLGLDDHIICNIHKSGHAVIAEDMNYMIDYFNEKVYGIKSERDLSNLKTSVFELPANKDPLFDSFGDTKPAQPKPDPAPSANANQGGGMGGFGGGMGGMMGGFGGGMPAMGGMGGFGGMGGAPAGGAPAGGMGGMMGGFGGGMPAMGGMGGAPAGGMGGMMGGFGGGMPAMGGMGGFGGMGGAPAGDANLVKLFDLNIKIDQMFSVQSTRGSANMLLFSGDVKSDFFEGKVLPGGVDTQRSGSISARYIIEGKTPDGKATKIFVENNSAGNGGLKPTILTDNADLGWLETADVTARIAMGGQGGVTIQFFVPKDANLPPKK